MNSTPEQPPGFAPGLPLFPHLAQLCRVSAPAILPGLYPGFVQQWTGTGLSLRDCEPCLVWEPNLVPLGQAVYDCRLEGSFLSLPLFATTCCVPPGSSSSSSSSSSGSAHTDCVFRRSLGTARTVSGTSLTLPVSFSTSESLLVLVVTLTGVLANVSASYGGFPLTADALQFLPDSPPGPPLWPRGRVMLFSGNAVAGTSGNVTVYVDGGVPGALTAQGVACRGTCLPTGVADQVGIGRGSSPTIPETGTMPATTYPDEYVQSAYLLVEPAAWVWDGGFTSGGQDVTQVVGGLSVSATEGYLILVERDGVESFLDDVPRAWAGVTATYH